jgi:hypothetical protein
MNLNSPTTMTRIRNLLNDLEAVRENLLALSDDIWQAIDHNDPDSLEAGVEFKRAYNTQAAAFDKNATELSTLVQKYTSVRLEEAEKTGGRNDAENERIIRDLNREEPHRLDENFTYKRPHGFVLDGRATTGITTWQRLYELVCHQLLAADEDRFRSLEEHPDFISPRGHRIVTRDRVSLRKAMELPGDLFIESNLSANSICDVIRRILGEFGIPEDRMQIYLRQDRDAGRGEDAK